MSVNKSPFQFTRPELKALDFSINDNFIPKDDSSIEIGINIETSVSINDQPLETGENTAEVSIALVIGSRSDDAPFYIEAKECANFKWNSSIIDEKNRNRLLKTNAPALLLSYIRPIVSMVTAASKYPTYNIPFLDLSKQIEKE